MLPAPDLGPSHNKQHHRYWWPCDPHYFSLYAVRVSCSTQCKFCTRSKVSVSLMSIPAKRTQEVAVTRPHRLAAGWLCLLLLFSFVRQIVPKSVGTIWNWKFEGHPHVRLLFQICVVYVCEGVGTWCKGTSDSLDTSQRAVNFPKQTSESLLRSPFHMMFCMRVRICRCFHSSWE